MRRSAITRAAPCTALLALIPLLQGAGIIRSIWMLAEEAASVAFQNGDLGSLIPSKIGAVTRQSPDAGLREALGSALVLNHGVKAVAAW